MAKEPLTLYYLFSRELISGEGKLVQMYNVVLNASSIQKTVFVSFFEAHVKNTILSVNVWKLNKPSDQRRYQCILLKAALKFGHANVFGLSMWT